MSLAPKLRASSISATSRPLGARRLAAVAQHQAALACAAAALSAVDQDAPTEQHGVRPAGGWCVRIGCIAGPVMHAASDSLTLRRDPDAISASLPTASRPFLAGCRFSPAPSRSVRQISTGPAVPRYHRVEQQRQSRFQPGHAIGDLLEVGIGPASSLPVSSNRYGA